MTSVGRVPETKAQISQFLADGELATRYTTQGLPLKIVVGLTRSADTVSGFAWSGGRGPPYRINPRTLVSSAVHLPDIHPADWLLAP